MESYILLKDESEDEPELPSYKDPGRILFLEGVIGDAWRDYFGEYDESWSFKYCRRASQSEIDTEVLDDAIV